MIRESQLNALVFAIFLAVPAWALWADEPFTITLMTRAAVFALAAVGLNIALGLGGLVSFGHAVFFGLGGYSMGILAYHAQTYTPLMEVPFLIEGTNVMPVIWLVAVVVSALAALLIGVLSLRTGGVYFIMITLAFGQMFYYFAISWSAYGGEDGLSIYVRNGFPGLNTLDPIQFYGLCLVLLSAALFGAHRLAKSPFGLALGAVRQAPQRVETVGLDGMRIKLVAFVISAALAGLAGSTKTVVFQLASLTDAHWHMSGEVILMTLLGGVGTLLGPIAGAGIVVSLQHVLGQSPLGNWVSVILGIIFVVCVLSFRSGIVGELARMYNKNFK